MTAGMLDLHSGDFVRKDNYVGVVVEPTSKTRVCGILLDYPVRVRWIDGSPDGINEYSFEFITRWKPGVKRITEAEAKRRIPNSHLKPWLFDGTVAQQGSKS